MSAGRGSPAPRTPEIDAGAAVARPGAGPFDRRVIGVGGVVFALLMALSARYGFHGDELYMLECARRLQASYVDQPVLAPLLDAAWFGGTRAGYHAGLGKYLERRMASGRLRPMPDAMVAARVVVESVAWFAWHRHEGRDAALYDDQTARRTVIEFACAALLPGSAPAGAQPHTARRASPPGLPPDPAPKEHQSWTQPPATIHPATSEHPGPAATGRCPG